jgi:DNA-binding NarL/FixJ family response regulator
MSATEAKSDTTRGRVRIATGAKRIRTYLGGHVVADTTEPVRELQATGATVRRRQPDTRDELTVQEKQIAQLARDGLKNAEIGGQLFLSPRTVEWHLRHIFSKLGIHSRHELANALPRSELARAEHPWASRPVTRGRDRRALARPYGYEHPR